MSRCACAFRRLCGLGSMFWDRLPAIFNWPSSFLLRGALSLPRPGISDQTPAVMPLWARLPRSQRGSGARARAERRVFDLQTAGELPNREILIFLNRLSDL